MLADRVIEETEARQLPALIDEWSRADDERRWIARALRIDLPRRSAAMVERREWRARCDVDRRFLRGAGAARRRAAARGARDAAADGT